VGRAREEGRGTTTKKKKGGKRWKNCHHEKKKRDAEQGRGVSTVTAKLKLSYLGNGKLGQKVREKKKKKAKPKKRKKKMW